MASSNFHLTGLSLLLPVLIFLVPLSEPWGPPAAPPQGWTTMMPSHGGGGSPPPPSYMGPPPQQGGGSGNPWYNNPSSSGGYGHGGGAAAPSQQFLTGRSYRHPSEIGRFQKYYVASLSPSTAKSAANYPLDVRGRSKVHPSSIGRFAKYFPGAPQCVCKHPDNPMINKKKPKSDTDAMGYYNTTFTHDNHPFNPKHVGCPKKPNFVDPVTGKQYLVPSYQTGPECNGTFSWYDALDFCQDAGLQTVALDLDKSMQEKKAILDMANNLGLKSFWTGGFLSQLVNGSTWKTLTWPSESESFIENVVPGTGLWSTTGPDGKPQPDNFAYRANPVPENLEKCVVVLNNWFNDGITLHDAKCLDLNPLICEVVPHAPKPQPRMEYTPPPPPSSPSPSPPPPPPPPQVATDSSTTEQTLDINMVGI